MGRGSPLSAWKASAGAMRRVFWVAQRMARMPRAACGPPSVLDSRVQWAYIGAKSDKERGSPYRELKREILLQR